MNIKFEMKQNKLISIENNLLVLNDLIEINNSIVISIVGDARKGKSTFLNLMINYITKEDKKYFNTSSDIKHCTIGIDYLQLLINDINYIFIDCQGLNYENASHDFKYLLFLYSISNIFIYNDKNIINNNIFSTLQPMAIFINMFDKFDSINKPILYFRIADYELTGDIEELKNNLFVLQNDQFDNVRESCRLLFSDIQIKITETITKNDKKLLNNNKYTTFLNDEDNNFINVIKDIYSNLEILPKKNINLDLLVNNINNNNKIDYKKLDIYTLNTELEIINFIDIYLLNNKEFDNIISNGTQETRNLINKYNNNIKKYENMFNDHFSSVPDEMKTKFIVKISEMKNKYKQFIDTNETIATNELKKIYNSTIDQIMNGIQTFYSTLNKHYNTDDLEYKKHINNNIEQFKIKSGFNNSIYNEFKKIFNNATDIFNEIFNSDVKNIYSKFDNKIYEMYYTELIEFIDQLNGVFNKIYEYNINIEATYLEELKVCEINIFKLIENINTIEDSKVGDYDKFIIDSNPYKSIILKKYIKIPHKNYLDNDDDFNIVEYCLEEIVNKKKYFDKYYNLSKLPKYFEYYKKILVTIVNKNGVYLLCPPDIYNITYIRFDYMRNQTIFIELNNFYTMLKILKIKDIIFKYKIEKEIKNFKSTSYNKNQIIDISYIIKYEIFKIIFIEYILENKHFNECMKIEQFNEISSNIINKL